MSFRQVEICLLLTLFVACSGGCTNNAGRRTDSFLADVHLVNTQSADPIGTDVKTFLQRQIDAAQFSDLCLPTFRDYQSAVRSFYDSRDDSLAWIQRGEPTPQALAIIAVLKNAAIEGLHADDYDGSRWDKRIQRLEAAQPISDSDLARFDLALTISTMRYVSDLHRGRVNPKLFHFDLNIDHTDFELDSFLSKELVSSTNVQDAMESLEPPFPIYRRTKTALQTYLNLAAKEEPPTLPVPPRPVRPGSQYSGLPLLAKKLHLLGDLPMASTPLTDVYQGDIVQGVRHFQQRNGMNPTGMLDAATVSQLNVPLSERITQLELTMERMRWVPHEFSEPPIIVNIPEFRVHAVDENFHWVLSMKVVVGKAYQHKTPVFASEIQAVTFRPYWNVPLSIVRAEIIPDIQKLPSYLSKNFYEVVDKKNQLVTDGPVTAAIEEGLRNGSLRVRQRPGPKNALGLIKFEIPSSYDVYMHGTPATELFSRSRRDFSHGCIRVDDPVAMAQWVLRNTPGWTQDAIRNATNGPDNVSVKLNKPIPVLILYGTAVVNENGEIGFFNDIYGYDASLQRGLEQRELQETKVDRNSQVYQ